MTDAQAVLYGVLDLARAPALHEHVERLEPAGAACLFEGRLDPALRRVSPHLVELAPGDPLARQWQENGWGHSWGILLRSPESLAFVRRRLRHFTLARLPNGRGPLLFRFWDPRVFRVYMPLVEADELAPWFKGIEHYIAESADGREAFRFSLRDGKLSVEQRQYAPP